VSFVVIEIVVMYSLYIIRIQLVHFGSVPSGEAGWFVMPSSE
jgi:hypothetical protein